MKKSSSARLVLPVRIVTGGGDVGAAAGADAAAPADAASAAPAGPADSSEVPAPASCAANSADVMGGTLRACEVAFRLRMGDCDRRRSVPRRSDTGQSNKF